MTDQYICAHILKVVLAKLDLNPERRSEALGDFLALSLPNMGEQATKALAELIPALPQNLYEKWIGLFSARLLETIPREELKELCNGTENNNATLGMVYLLFMESARMEEQTARDLAELGFNSTGAEQNYQLSGKGQSSQVADALSVYLKAQLGQKMGQP